MTRSIDHDKSKQTNNDPEVTFISKKKAVQEIVGYWSIPSPW